METLKRINIKIEGVISPSYFANFCVTCRPIFLGIVRYLSCLFDRYVKSLWNNARQNRVITNIFDIFLVLIKIQTVEIGADS